MNSGFQFIMSVYVRKKYFKSIGSILIPFGIIFFCIMTHIFWRKKQFCSKSVEKIVKLINQDNFFPHVNTLSRANNDVILLCFSTKRNWYTTTTSQFYQLLWLKLLLGFSIFQTFSKNAWSFTWHHYFSSSSDVQVNFRLCQQMAEPRNTSCYLCFLVSHNCMISTICSFMARTLTSISLIFIGIRIFHRERLIAPWFLN